MTVTATELSIRKVTGTIGAEISGVRLSAGLPDDVIQRIRAAILAHKVVYFRDQDHLDDAAQFAFGGRLGTVTQAHPTVAPDADVLNLDYTAGAARANIWHTDVTFVQQPPSFSLLRSVEIPPVGGDTLWANTVTGYQSLPADLRDLADKLWALHTNEFDYAQIAATKDGPDPRFQEYASNFASTVYKTAHPVVRVHPETGERALLLGGFARTILGQSTFASESLKKIFQDAITAPENTVRWSWRVGDLAIWDNRATQHYVSTDWGSAARRLRRVTVVGEVPASVDGEPSRSLQGDSAAYNRAD